MESKQSVQPRIVQSGETPQISEFTPTFGLSSFTYEPKSIEAIQADFERFKLNKVKREPWHGLLKNQTTICYGCENALALLNTFGTH